MKILVNDTNIFIDLHSVGLLEEMAGCLTRFTLWISWWRKLQMPTSEEFLMNLLLKGEYS